MKLILMALLFVLSGCVSDGELTVKEPDEPRRKCFCPESDALIVSQGLGKKPRYSKCRECSEREFNSYRFTEIIRCPEDEE